jgi:hypothetical protein
VAADPGLTIIVYTVEPASVAAEALAILASWCSAPIQSTSDEPLKG